MILHHKYDVTVIGGGPCGMYASFVLSMLGLKTCIVEKSHVLGGQCMHIYPEKPIFDIPGFPEINAKDLVNNLARQMDKFTIGQYLGQSIQTIEHNKLSYLISLESMSIESRAVVMAVGEGSIVPRKINIDGSDFLEQRGYVQYLMKDLTLFQNKKIAIAGGGDSAADWAITLLAGVAEHVTIIHRRDSLRCMDSLQHQLNKLKNENKFDFLLNAKIKSLSETADKKISVTISEEQQAYEYDYLIVCYGSDSNKNHIMSSFSKDIVPKINHDNCIIIDPYTCMTSQKNVYAIGDGTGYANEKCSRPKIIAIGFGEANTASYHIRKSLFSDRTYRFTHSTSMGK